MMTTAFKRCFSRYHRRFPRSLVYMLQASGYNIPDYLQWYHRAEHLSRVEQRKQLEKTKKAITLLVIAWLIVLACAVLALACLFFLTPPWSYLLCIAIIILAPTALPYLLVIPVFLLQAAIQRPMEQLIIKRAHKKLMRHPAARIAVAGSFGKTTMREILKTVLSEAKKVAAPPASYNTPLGISTFIERLAGDEDILIFEFGEEYPGDVKKLSELAQPQWGFVTGVNEAHLERFKHIDETVRTIFELRDALGATPLYINGENALAKEQAREHDLLYTREGCGEWHIKDATTGLEGTSFICKNGDAEIHASSKLLGLHQIGPLVAACDIATKLGLTAKQIEEGIAKTKPFEHRLQPSTDANEVTILDDSYNGNPDGVSAVINFLGSLRGHHRTFYITPGLVEMGSRTEAVHKNIGHELAAAQIHHVILIRDSVTPYIEEGLTEANFQGTLTWFDDMPTALRALPHLTVKGDVVLIQNDWPDQYV